MLVGIVEKNAIMMIGFALEAPRAGKSPAPAIYGGCLLRFRPIMMTTMAALRGTLPIALGFGAGADARRPLGLAVVGGLLVSQLLTLYIIMPGPGLCRVRGVAVSGQLDPGAFRAGPDRYCFFHHDAGGWMLVHSHHPAVLDATHRGDEFLSRLEAE